MALKNPGLTGFLAEGPNSDVIYSSGIINLLFDGLTYNAFGNFSHCSYFSEPRLRNSQSIRAYYMLTID